MKRILLVGAGGIGQRHFRAFVEVGDVRMSVCEPDAAKRNQLSAACDVESACADIGEADLSGFDAAVICAPAHLHVPIAQRCADAGVSFLLEKPLAVTMDGVDHLIETVNAKRLLAHVGYVRRASPETAQFRKEILSGKIGAPRMCYINMSQEFPKYRPDFQRTYYAKRETGGGAILDAASHMVDLLLWIMGDVAEVSAMYDRLVLQGVDVEDSALISLRLTDGNLAQINVNQFQKPNVCVMEVIGAKGNLVFDMVRSELRFAADDSGTWEVRKFNEGLSPADLALRRLAAQASRFLGALDGRPSELATLEEAQRNLRVVLAAKQSYETRRIVRL
ncbi:MAG: Gfo/Idh/MocA family oxidoreductase [Planctomycetota bacterium]